MDVNISMYVYICIYTYNIYIHINRYLQQHARAMTPSACACYACTMNGMTDSDMN